MQLAAAHKLAYEMVEEHLHHSDWAVTFDRSRHRAGMTNFKKGVISLSIPFVLRYSEREVEQLMLHEIAHVLVGPGKDHGKEWKDQAKKLGYEGGATVDGLPNGGADWWKPWLASVAIIAGAMPISPIVASVGIGIWVSVAAVKIWGRIGPVPQVYKPLR